MNNSIEPARMSPHEAPERNLRHGSSRRPEIFLWALLLMLLNQPLLNGGPAEALIFRPDAVAAGQWWRVLSFPFVHLSGYHLLLDAAAFLLLYQGLEEDRIYRRLLYVLLPASFSLILSLSSPVVQASGLCGLSGVAHGLMAITALELVSDRPSGSALARTGWILLAIVMLKTLLEILGGKVLLAGLHFGDIGTPVVESHAGGVLGGLIAFLLLNRPMQRCTPITH